MSKLLKIAVDVSLVVLTIWALVATYLFLSFSTLKPAEYGKHSAAATVFVGAEDGGHGSGVYIGGGRIITAAHVAKEGDTFTIKQSDAADAPSAQAHVVWYDEKADVGMLMLDAPLAGLYAETLACTAPDVVVGEEVVAIGDPLTFMNLHTFGRVADGARERVVDEAGTKQVSIIVDLTIAPGNSGGPLFNKRGEVVGITVATAQVTLFRRFPNLLPLAYVIPRSIICKLIASPPVMPTKEETPTS